MKPGSLGVSVRDKPLTSDEWADKMLAKVISVSDSAPQPIRDQAMAFRANLRTVFIHYLEMAMAEARADVVKQYGDHTSRLR